MLMQNHLQAITLFLYYNHRLTNHNLFDTWNQWLLFKSIYFKVTVLLKVLIYNASRFNTGLVMYLLKYIYCIVMPRTFKGKAYCKSNPPDADQDFILQIYTVAWQCMKVWYVPCISEYSITICIPTDCSIREYSI